MSTDLRARYLNQRVLTASPAQRVVMLYDRFHLDLARASDAISRGESGAEFLDHATQIVAELMGSLNATAGGPADNLASLYGFLLRELTAVRTGETKRLKGAQDVVTTLREAWTQAATATATSNQTPVAAGAWVG